MNGFTRWILLSALVFFTCVVIGFVVPVEFDLESIAPFGEMVSDFESFSSPVIFIIILMNNLVAISFAFFLSPLLCIVPLFSLVVNGLIVGVVGAMVIEQESFLYLAAGILPHGIFEIPALLIALAAGLNFGFIALKGIFKKEARPLVLPGFITNVKYLALGAGLLVPAAFIETFITPLILGLF